MGTAIAFVTLVLLTMIVFVGLLVGVAVAADVPHKVAGIHCV